MVNLWTDRCARTSDWLSIPNSYFPDLPHRHCACGPGNQGKAENTQYYEYARKQQFLAEKIGASYNLLFELFDKLRFIWADMLGHLLQSSAALLLKFGLEFKLYSMKGTLVIRYIWAQYTPGWWGRSFWRWGSFFFCSLCPPPWPGLAKTRFFFFKPNPAGFFGFYWVLLGFFGFFWVFYFFIFFS